MTFVSMRAPIAPTSQFISRGDRQIAWRETGSGPTALLFIHGWCGDQTSWRHQMAAFSDHFRCLSIDLAGHGATAPLAPQTLSSLADLAEDVNALREACGIHDVILVGHSMGGPVAIEAARAEPSGVVGIVGVDTFTDARMYAPRADDEIEQRLDQFSGDFPAAMAGLVRMITLVDREGTGLEHDIVRVMTSTPLSVARLAMQRLLEWDIDVRWQLANNVPARAINSRALVPLIMPLPARTGLEIRLMDEVGHFPMLEDPSAFNAELRQVLLEMQMQMQMQMQAM